MSGYGIRKTDMKYLLICAGLLLIVFHSWGQERLADRIAPPSGYVRETCSDNSVSYTHLRAHETRHDIVCRLLLEKKKTQKTTHEK